MRKKNFGLDSQVSITLVTSVIVELIGGALGPLEIIDIESLLAEMMMIIAL